jgi:cyanophycinase
MKSKKKGALFLIGGAADTVFADFVRLAGGSSAHIAVITHASGEAKESGDNIAAALRQLGVTRVSVLLPNRRNLPAGVTAIYIGGGDQNRLVKLTEANGLAQQIRDANRRGVLVAGTSAGAAGAVQVMIAGDNNWKKRIRLGAVLFGTGLCLRANLIVDTHFGQRKRQSRLRIALGMFDDVVGLGLDEDTAAYIVGDTVEVFGKRKVRLYTRDGGTEFRSIARGCKETTYSAGGKFALVY